MRKGRLLLLLTAVAVLLAGLCLREQQKRSGEALILQLTDLSRLLREEADFARAAQDEGLLTLYSPDGAAVGVIPLTEEEQRLFTGRRVLGVHKTGDDVFFITGGAVDDETGYAVSADGELCMDGIWHAERVAGGVFRYRTYP